MVIQNWVHHTIQPCKNMYLLNACTYRVGEINTYKASHLPYMHWPHQIPMMICCWNGPNEYFLLAFWYTIAPVTKSQLRTIIEVYLESETNRLGYNSHFFIQNTAQILSAMDFY